MSPVTRRQLLTAALASAVGGVAVGMNPVQAAINPLFGFPTPAAHPPARTALLQAVPSPSLPLTVTSDSHLSQDFFLSAEVLIGDTADAVYPVVVSTGIAAVVLINGILSLLRPDPGSPTGWDFSTIDTGYTGSSGSPVGVATLAAVQTTDQSKIDVALTYTDSTDTLIFGSIDVDGSWLYWSSIDNKSYLASWQGNISENGSAYFYNWRLGDHFQIDIIFAREDASAGTLSATIDMSRDVGNSQGKHVTPRGLINSQIVCNPIVGTAEIQVYGLFQDQSGEVFFMNAPNSASDDTWSLIYNGIDAVGTSALWGQPLWMPNPQDPTTLAAALFNDPAGIPYAATCTGNYELTAYELMFGPDSAGQILQADWFADSGGTLWIYLLTTDNTLWLQTITLPAAGQPGVTSAPIPIAEAVAQFYLARRGMTSSTALFVQGLDTGLELLSREGLGVWTATPVLQNSPTSQEVTTYRTLLTVTDANGVPQPSTDLTVTPTADVAVWQMNASTVMAAGVPTTFTTDTDGQICLASPADTLQTTSLTVTLGGVETAVYPDGELHAFLSGTSTMLVPGPSTDPNVPPTLIQAPLTGDLLQSATMPSADPSNPAPVPLFAGLTGASAGTAQGAAAAISTVMNHPQVPAATGFSIGGGSGAPVNIAPMPLSQSGLGESVTDWWDSVKHDIESVYRALASEVTHIVSVAADGLDAAGNLLVHFVITIGKDISDIIEIVVSDLKSAAMAVVGIIRMLGATLDDALSWLRTLIVGLFIDVVAVGDALYHALTVTAPATFDTGIQTLGGQVAGFFSAAESGLNTSFSDVLTTLSPYLGTFDGAKASTGLAPPTGDEAKAGASNTSAKSHWLKDKAQGVTASQFPDGTADPSAFSAQYSASSNSTTFEGAVKSMFTGLLPTGSSVDSFLSGEILGLLTALDTLLDAGMALLDDVFQELLNLLTDLINDLLAAIAAPLEEIPVLGDLFRLLGIGSLNIGQIACYIIAFPLVVSSKLLGFEQPLFPTDGLGLEQDFGSFTLNVMGLVTQLASTFSVAAIDVQVANGAIVAKPFNVVNAVISLLVTITQFPFAPGSDVGSDIWTSSAPNSTVLFGDDEPLISWCLSFIPIGLTFLTAGSPEFSDISLFVNCIAGVILTIVETFGAAEQNPLSPGSIIISAIGNLPAVCAPLATSTIQEELGDIPVAVKVAVDVAVPVASAYVNLAQAILAAV